MQRAEKKDKIFTFFCSFLLFTRPRNGKLEEIRIKGAKRRKTGVKILEIFSKKLYNNIWRDCGKQHFPNARRGRLCPATLKTEETPK